MATLVPAHKWFLDLNKLYFERVNGKDALNIEPGEVVSFAGHNRVFLTAHGPGKRYRAFFMAKVLQEIASPRHNVAVIQCPGDIWGTFAESTHDESYASLLCAWRMFSKTRDAMSIAAEAWIMTADADAFDRTVFQWSMEYLDDYMPNFLRQSTLKGKLIEPILAKLRDEKAERERRTIYGASY